MNRHCNIKMTQAITFFALLAFSAYLGKKHVCYFGFFKDLYLFFISGSASAVPLPSTEVNMSPFTNSTSNYRFSNPANYDVHVSDNVFSNRLNTLLLLIMFGILLILQILLILAWIYAHKRRQCQSICEQYKNNITVDTWKVPTIENFTQTNFEVIRVKVLPKEQNLIQHQLEQHCMTIPLIPPSIVLDHPGDLQPTYSWVYQPNDDAISIFI